MDYTPRNLGFAAFGVVLLLLPSLWACEADDTTGLDADGSPSVDAAVTMDAGGGGDALVLDGGADPGPMMPPGASDLWLGSARGNESLDSFEADDDATSCFDGVDNDFADNASVDGIDCEDPQCQALPSCCANEADCVAGAETFIAVDYAECADAVCGQDYLPFGGPDQPSIDRGALALQGDMFFDSGMFGTQELNLRDQRIDLAIRFRLGACPDCGESAAVALTNQDSPNANTFIRPLVGLRALSATESTAEEVQLIIHDRVAAVFPAGDLSVPWNLSIRPDGEVRVEHAGVVMDTKEYIPSSSAHIALYGHSRNPGENDGARIVSLDVQRYATDRVDAWAPPRSLEHQGGRVSVASLDGVDYLAVNDDAGDEPHSVRFYVASDGSDLNWTFTEDWSARDYTIVGLGGELFVYAVQSDGALVRGLVNLETLMIGPSEVEVHPSALGWSSLRNPSVIEFGGYRILVAEVDGALEAAFSGTSWLEIGSLSEMTVGGREPSLLVHNGVYWLHYSVQSGTRRRVRALVSDQMIHWRALGDALGGSGEAGSVNRFSASSPALVSAGDSLRMYFDADDHVMRRLAVTERGSPSMRNR